MPLSGCTLNTKLVKLKVAVYLDYGKSAAIEGEVMISASTVLLTIAQFGGQIVTGVLVAVIVDHIHNNHSDRY
ncbi:hypothetical protein [Secundilactobacillus pentosiphilus]|uniref:hypothetical protein n=1 Tax=Secundilactobacillus pentosiphilus TaxID=1714682 RepID=UPI000F788BCE|nr:hypothetical protein [Secundilactobacillus pentosiphilus]